MHARRPIRPSSGVLTGLDLKFGPETNLPESGLLCVSPSTCSHVPDTCAEVMENAGGMTLVTGSVSTRTKLLLVFVLTVELHTAFGLAAENIPT